MKVAKIGDDATYIGLSAFKDDTALTLVDRLSAGQDPSTIKFNVVEDYAFANTRLQHVDLALRSSSIYTWWGDYCFAYNPNLTSISFLPSCATYMSKGMFKDCINLKQVTYYNNMMGWIYPGVFENCSSLTSI